jgi:hypothetical protein
VVLTLAFAVVACQLVLGSCRAFAACRLQGMCSCWKRCRDQTCPHWRGKDEAAVGGRHVPRIMAEPLAADPARTAGRREPTG